MNTMISTAAILALVWVLIASTGSDDDRCHDVTVVGGGVVGAYAVWRLRQRGFNIGLYELSDRLGGRFYTYRFPQAPDIPIELGAMRFSMNEHPILYQTVKEVELDTNIFPGQDYLSDEALFFLRGKYLRNEDLNENRVPYNLCPFERRGIQEIYRYLTTKTNFSGDMTLLNEERHFLVSDDGVRLTDQTIQEFFRKYLSEEAVDLISNVYTFSLFNQSAAIKFQFMPSNGTLPKSDMVTISGGMQKLPERLVKQFLSTSRHHSLNMNHKLVSITRKTNTMYSLGFIKTRTAGGRTILTSKIMSVCSRRVILAVPTPALRRINWEVLQRQHVIANLDTVNYFFAIKLYLVYDFPWWKDCRCKTVKKTNSDGNMHSSPKTATAQLNSGSDKYKRKDKGTSVSSDLPLYMTFDFGVSNKTGKAVLLAAYSVNEMWKELQKHEDYINGNHSVSMEVVRHAHFYLSKLYNIPVSAIPNPTDGLLFHWDDFPFHASFCVSKTGVNWKTVWKAIHKPSEIDDIVIASGSYSKRMSDAWSEYNLETIKEIIDTYF